MNPTYAAVIERVEKATGPDRELDALIWLLLQPGCEYIGYARCQPWSAFGIGADDVTNPGSWVHGVVFRDASRKVQAFSSADHYTAFIDAALTLVPTEAFWRLGHDGEGADPSLFRADVLILGMPVQKAVHEHAACALVAAALRARAAEANTKESI